MDVSHGTFRAVDVSLVGSYAKCLHKLRERPYQAGGSAQMDTPVGV